MHPRFAELTPGRSHHRTKPIHVLEQHTRADGGSPEEEGDPLDLVPMQVVGGEIYVDPTRRIPRG